MDSATKNLVFVPILLLSCLAAFGGTGADVQVVTCTTDGSGNVVATLKTEYVAGEDIVVSVTLTNETKDNPDLSRIRIIGEFSSIITNKKLGGVIPGSGSLESGEAGPYNWTISSAFISSTLGNNLTGEDYDGDGFPDYIGLIEFTIFVDSKNGSDYNLIAESSVSVTIFAPEGWSDDGGLLSDIPIVGLIGFIVFLVIGAVATYRGVEHFNSKSSQPTEQKRSEDND